MWFALNDLRLFRYFGFQVVKKLLHAVFKRAQNFLPFLAPLLAWLIHPGSGMAPGVGGFKFPAGFTVRSRATSKAVLFSKGCIYHALKAKAEVSVHST